MPRVKLSSERLAMARTLEADHWTHEKIAALMGVNRSTVTHALRNRKTMLPGQVEQQAAELVGKIQGRALCAARCAIAAELRAIADNLSRGSPL